VWRSELAANEPLVEYYFRHPSYNNYPVVGVSWRQASDFCIWRSNRVNELVLVQKGLANPNQLKSIQGQGEENFTTKSYLLGLYTTQAARSKKTNLVDENGRPRSYTKIEDGILLPDYRLPTEAEWEYAALAYIQQNPNVKKKEGKRGEELIMNRQVYSWSQNVNGLRDSRTGSWQGKYLANFKRGAGDYMGIAGGLNDNSSIPGPIDAFYPNGFGLYNMSGNVNEWVADVYRSNSSKDVDDFNPYRGNVFTKAEKDANGEYQRDSIGRVKMIPVTEADLKNRRNYSTYWQSMIQRVCYYSRVMSISVN
jgi:gliding motility-associated lipoprotein GldJ